MSDKSKKQVIGMKGNKQVKYIFFAVILVIITVMGELFFNGTLMINKEKRLENELTRTGKKFYTNFYYDQITKGKNKNQIKTELENFKSIGIKVNLNSLKKYSYDVNKKSINLLEKNGCDITNTSVTIHPKKPYTKTDFSIKTNLECKSK